MFLDSKPTDLTAGEGATLDSRLQTLDVLRGVAVLSVFCFHYLGAVFGTDQLPSSGNWLDFCHPPRQEFLLFLPLSLGWMGVPLFFVISGFCIHLSFLKQQQFSATRFYRRRLFRLYPAYALIFLFSWVVAYQRHENHIWTQLAAHLMLVQNFFPNDIVFGINGALWSIATEIQFYLVYPLIVWQWRRTGLRIALFCAFVVMVVGRLSLSSLQAAMPEFAAAMATSPLLLLFDWMLGISLADCWWRGEHLWLAGKRWAYVFLAALLLSILWRPASNFSFPFASLFFASIMGRLNLAKIPRGRSGKLLRLIGLGSYSFYLIHQPLSAWLLQKSPALPVIWNMTAVLTVVGIVTFLTSQVLFTLIERPFWRVSSRPSP